MKCPVEIAQEISVWRVKEKKITWQAAEKMAARRAVEKPRGGKVKKPTFPPRLEIPQTPAGFPLSHSPDDYGRLTKIEYSLFYEKGTLLSRNSPSETLRRSFKPRQQLR